MRILRKIDSESHEGEGTREKISNEEAESLRKPLYAVKETRKKKAGNLSDARRL